jgi:peptidoglycan/LPS O-acetylase OafA/YrhL
MTVQRAGSQSRVRAGTQARPRRAEVPAATKRLLPLDGMRAVAAGLVLVFHVAMQTGLALQPGVAGALLSRAEIGVQLFFGLSGVLLYRPFAVAALGRRPAPPVSGYFLRRALRILPSYWLVLGVVLAIWHRDRVADTGTLLPLGLLVQNYVPSPWWSGYGPDGLKQAWSLSVEVSFYLVLPLLAAVGLAMVHRADDIAARARRLLYGIAVLGGLAVGWTMLVFVPTYHGFLYMYLPRCLGYFAVGMALAVVAAWARLAPDGPAARFSRWTTRNWWLCWMVAAVLYFVAATPLTGPRTVPFDGLGTAVAEVLLYSAISAAVLTPVALLPARSTRPGRILGNRLMAYLGRISYGVFLWQFVVIFKWYDVTHQQPWTGRFWINLAAVTVIVNVLAAANHHLIEEPIRRLYRHRNTEMRDAKPVGSSDSTPRRGHRDDRVPARGAGTPPATEGTTGSPGGR